MMALAVHGGAGEIPRNLKGEHRKGVAAALEAGRRRLEQGASAVEAVVAAVMVLEDNPAFNAGFGAVLNAQGEVELDAGLMRGEDLEMGAVASVRDVAHPIQLCRHLLDDREIFFAGEPASRLAEAAGLDRVAPGSLVSARRRRHWERGAEGSPLDAGLGSDTVGAVALDGEGHLAAGTSTGGLHRKPPGRIGDSPLPGGGFYAADEAGACSATGWGEALARFLISRRALEALERGEDPDVAVTGVIDELAERIPGARGGLILLTPQGRFAAAFNTPSMTRAWWNEAGEAGIRV